MIETFQQVASAMAAATNEAAARAEAEEQQAREAAMREHTERTAAARYRLAVAITCATCGYVPIACTCPEPDIIVAPQAAAPQWTILTDLDIAPPTSTCLCLECRTTRRRAIDEHAVPSDH